MITLNRICILIIINLQTFFLYFKSLKNILVDNLKQMVYKVLVQHIVSYGIVNWSSAYKIHIAKLEISLSTLIKYLILFPFTCIVFVGCYLSIKILFAISNYNTRFIKQN